MWNVNMYYSMYGATRKLVKSIIIITITMSNLFAKALVLEIMYKHND